MMCLKAAKYFGGKSHYLLLCLRDWFERRTLGIQKLLHNDGDSVSGSDGDSDGGSGSGGDNFGKYNYVSRIHPSKHGFFQAFSLQNRRN